MYNWPFEFVYGITAAVDLVQKQHTHTYMRKIYIYA